MSNKKVFFIFLIFSIYFLLGARAEIPILNPIGNKTVNEGELLQFTVNATGDNLTYHASNLPSGANFDSNTRVFSWTPDYNQAGTYTGINFTVTDSNDQSASEEITITVNNINRAPILDSIGNKTVNEGQTLQFTINATDPDGDTLTYSASNLPSGANFDSNTRVFSWTPDHTQAGNHPGIHFEVKDSGNLMDSEDITITVNNINHAPILDSIGNKTVNEGQTLQFIINATDPDGDTLTYSASNLPSGATFDANTKKFNWIPDFDQVGSYSGIRFEVSDGNLKDSKEITITVNNVNRAPVLDPIGDRTVSEGQLLRFTINATDPDGDSLTYSASNLPSGATFDANIRVFSWTPNYTQAGSYLIYFTVTDGNLVDNETVRVTVFDVTYTSDPPSNLNATWGNFWVNHTWDAGAKNVSYYEVWVNGAFIKNTTELHYNHTGLSPHSWSNLSIRSHNSTMASYSDWVNHNFQIPNNPIILSGIQNSYSIIEGQELSIDANYFDADNDIGTFADNSEKWDVNPSTGVVSWITREGDEGTYNWQITVSDGYGPPATKSFTVIVSDSTPVTPANLTGIIGNFWVNHTWEKGANTDSFNISHNGAWHNGTTDTYFNATVGPHGWSNISIAGYNNTLDTLSGFISQSTQVPNNPPVQHAIGNREIYKGQELIISISATDADSDHITYGTNATKGSLNNETGVFTWVPNDNDEGTYRWEFNSSDGYGGVANEVIWITVKNPLETNINFIEPTIINNNESWVDAKFGHIGKFIGVDGTFENKGNDLLILNITEIYNNGSQHWLPFKPLAPNESMSYIQLFGRPAFEISSTGVDEELKVFNFTLVINVTGQNGSIFYINTTTISLPIYPIFKIKRADGSMVVVGEGRTTPITYTLEANSSINLTNVSINDYNPSTPNNHSKYFGTIEANKPQSISYTYSATTADLSSNKCEESIPGGYPCIINLATFTGEMNGVPIKDTDFVELPVCKETDKKCLQGYTVNRIPNRGSDGSGYRSYSGGGGGGGGGGIPPSEDYKNIERREVREMDTLAKTASVYIFSAADPVMVVSFESSVSENGVPVSVEVLKNRSKRIGVDAPGKPYKYFNIFAGTSGFSKKISNGVVVYRVNNSWLEENGLDPGDISLYKWQGEWVRKSTEIAESRANYTYYASLVGNFSSFAIAGVKKQDITLTSPPAVNNSVSASKIEELAMKNSSLSKSAGFIKSLSQNPKLPAIVLIFLVIGIIYYLKRNHKI